MCWAAIEEHYCVRCLKTYYTGYRKIICSPAANAGKGWGECGGPIEDLLMTPVAGDCGDPNCNNTPAKKA